MPFLDFKYDRNRPIFEGYTQPFGLLLKEWLFANNNFETKYSVVLNGHI